MICTFSTVSLWLRLLLQKSSKYFLIFSLLEYFHFLFDVHSSLCCIVMIQIILDFNDFRETFTWEFFFLGGGLSRFFEGDPYVTYRVQICVSDDSFWCLGPIGTCLDHYRHRWVVRIDISLPYLWRFCVKISRFERL